MAGRYRGGGIGSPGSRAASTQACLADFAAFQNCFTGDGSTDVPPCCRIFDFEPDEDVDLEDHATFEPPFSCG